MVWSNEQIEQWHLIQKAYLEDALSVTQNKHLDIQRVQAQQEMLQLLGSFLEGSVTLKEFNTVFQQKTHALWNAFSLRGMSGGLFLNKLVKHIPNEESLAHQLRSALRIPKIATTSHSEDFWDGRKRMQSFTQFLEGWIASQQVLRSQLQPARVPFFLSVWWHLQATECWPIFYFHLRQVFQAGEPSKAQQDPVEAYFQFRSCFTSLAEALHTSLWELEHLCLWRCQQTLESRSSEHRSFSASAYVNGGLWNEHQPARLVQPERKSRQHSSIPNGKSISPSKEMLSSSLHTHLQWLLARIGRKVGYQVWIAGDRHNTMWKNERLGDLSIEVLPPVEDPLAQQIMQATDILWFQKNHVVAVYEVVQAFTEISAALLRLCDLSSLFPKRDLHLCIVAPHHCFERLLFELSRPTFQRNERLKHLALIPADMLVQDQEHILRWARSPLVIHDLVNNLGSGAQL